MALGKGRADALNALIRKAAAEVVRLNPHIGALPSAGTEDELAEIEQVDAEIERLWDSEEGQQARELGYAASDAVDEDRGG